MSDELFIALVGIFIGWLLNELAGAVRLAREERQLVRRSLPLLTQLYFEQYRINEILTFFSKKMGDDLELLYRAVEKDVSRKDELRAALDKYIKDFEGIRQTNIKTDHIAGTSSADALSAAIDDLARVDPSSAYRARRLLSEFVLFQNIDM